MGEENEIIMLFVCLLLLLLVLLGWNEATVEFEGGVEEAAAEEGRCFGETTAEIFVSIIPKISSSNLVKIEIKISLSEMRISSLCLDSSEANVVDIIFFFFFKVKLLNGSFAQTHTLEFLVRECKIVQIF